MLGEILWISEAGIQHSISKRRFENMLRQEKQFTPHLRLHTIPQIAFKDKKGAACKELLKLKLKQGLELTRNPKSLVLITQDDVHFCNNFITELETSLQELPADWRILHLCAGYLWNRKKNKPDFDKHLPASILPNPEGPIPNEKIVKGSRFVRPFVPAWPGGPVAFLVRRESIEEVLHDIQTRSDEEADDESLTMIAGEKDYMQYSPLLCYEREQGGPTHLNYVDSEIIEDVKSTNFWNSIVPWLIMFFMISVVVFCLNLKSI